jgi:quercetin dioxygenase-like cupin family protein
MRLAPLACAVFVVVAALPAAAQDPVKVASAQYKLIAENEHVRVLRATLPPGVTTAMHAHPAHIGVTLTGGSLRMGLPDGKTQDMEAKPDEVISVLAAGSHTTSNTGKTPIEVIVIEMKGTAGSATLPSSRPGMKMTPLLQDARVDAYRVSADSSFQEAAGTTHPYDQVVIPLAVGDIALTMDGKTTSTWKRGDVRLIGRGVPHETKGGKAPSEMIIVAVK